MPLLEQLVAATFDGGLNLLDAPSELAENETPDCMNVTLDERGGMMKRLGYVKKNVSALPGIPQLAEYWPSKQITVFQIGATLYKTPDDFSSWSSFQTFTSSARCAVCDFNGKLVIVHPVDGVYTYDGTTLVLVTASVKGTCIAPWQNKVFVGGDPSNPSRLWWSNAGNPGVFTIATDFNDLREKDDLPITAIGLQAGQDNVGRPGLLVFKEESAYRVNSPSTGSYTTISGALGAAGPLAVTSLYGITAAISKNGIAVTDSNGLNELRLVSGKLAPMFRAEQINFNKQDLFCAGNKDDRMVFSFPWGASQASNNRTLEFHPLDGWIVPHSFGVACFTTYGKGTRKLYAASPTASYVYEMFKGGSDDGAAITARYQTRWITPADEMNCSFRRVRVSGRGAFSLFTKLDYTLGEGELNAVSILGTAKDWNDAGSVWNNGDLWGPSLYEDTQDFWSLGKGHSISFELTHTGTGSSTGPALLDDGTSPEVGAFALYSLTLDYVKLGIS